MKDQLCSANIGADRRRNGKFFSPFLVHDKYKEIATISSPLSLFAFVKEIGLPSEALNTILHFVPIDQHKMAISVSSAIGFKVILSMKARAYDYARIFGTLPRIINQPLDSVTPFMDFEKIFQDIISSRSE